MLKTKHLPMKNHGMYLPKNVIDIAFIGFARGIKGETTFCITVSKCTQRQNMIIMHLHKFNLLMCSSILFSLLISNCVTNVTDIPFCPIIGRNEGTKRIYIRIAPSKMYQDGSAQNHRNYAGIGMPVCRQGRAYSNYPLNSIKIFVFELLHTGTLKEDFILAAFSL